MNSVDRTRDLIAEGRRCDAARLGGKGGDGPLYTVKDFAAVLRVDAVRLQNYIRRSGLPAVFAHRAKSAGQRRYYELRVLKAWWSGLDEDVRTKIGGAA